MTISHAGESGRKDSLDDGGEGRRGGDAPMRSSPGHADSQIAPRNETEERLAGIWRQVLGIPAVGVTDNFFALGGQKRQAEQMLVEVEKAFAVTLSPCDSNDISTIADLAGRLVRSQWSLPGSCLVPVQAGGTSVPFFCVPWAGGDVMSFGGLARRLGQDQPFYGLEPKGMDGLEPPHSSVDEMVTYYLSAIWAFRPKGPYLLGGRCFGGLVAFEMACRLREQGQDVPLLVLLDSSQPGRRISLLAHAKRLFFHHLPRGQFFYSLKRDIIEKVSKLKRRFVSRTDDKITDRVWKAHERARMAFVPKRYPGRITLFHSEEFRLRFPDYEDKWRELAEGGVDCHIVPGTHHDMLEEPSLQFVAERFRAALATVPKHS